MMERNNSWFERISFALFLVFIGTLFLLSNLGFVSLSDIFTLFFRYWPILVISWGIKLVLQTLKYGNWLGLAVDVIINVSILLALIFLNGGDTKFTLNSVVKYEELKDMNITIDNQEGIKSRDYLFEIGAASFSMNDGGKNPLSVSGNRVIGLPELKYEVKDGKLVSNFRTNTLKKMFYINNSEQSFKFDLGLDDTPLDFRLKLGAGKGNISLKSTQLSSLNVDVGAGELIIDLRGNKLLADMNLNVGAGNVLLRVDKSTNLTLNYNVGLGLISLKNREQSIDKGFGGFAGKGSFIVNEEVSSSKSTFNISVGAGNVEVVME